MYRTISKKQAYKASLCTIIHDHNLHTCTQLILHTIHTCIQNGQLHGTYIHYATVKFVFEQRL